MNNGDPLIWQLMLLFILIMISGFFSCAEISLISLDKNKLEKQSLSSPGTKGGRQAKRILSLTSKPSDFLATLQVGSILAGFLASAFAASHISGRLGLWLVARGLGISPATLTAASLIIITVILTFFQILFGELVPRRVAMKKADTLAYPISGFVLFLSHLFAPIVWLLSKSTNGVLRIIGISPEAESHAVTEDDIRLLIDVGSARGTIKDGEKELLNNVFELDNKNAGEVMTHRRDTVLLRLEDSDDDWEKTITENKHSFFPVCGKNPDDIAGVLKARDYLCLKDRRRETVISQAMSPAQLVPTSVRTDRLLRRMRRNRNHFAVVLDEHGGMMGIVTVKDLLEELVGNLDDDDSNPPEQPLIVKLEGSIANSSIADSSSLADSQAGWIVNGAVSLDKAARELGVNLPVEQYDTFGGFVFSLLGRIPEDGSYQSGSNPEDDDGGLEELEAHGLKIKILEVREHCLEKALVIKDH